jgi:hypothetical protein
MVAAVDRIGMIQRTNCRQAFDARFSVERMAQDYVNVYRQLMGEREQPGEDSGWASSQILLDRW